MKCCNQGCDQPATHGLEIKLYAKGYPKLDRFSMKMFMPVPMCLDHAREVEVRTFFIDESWKRIESAIIAVGKAPPDRETADISPAPLRAVQDMMKTAEARPDTITINSPEKQN